MLPAEICEKLSEQLTEAIQLPVACFEVRLDQKKRLACLAINAEKAKRDVEVWKADAENFKHLITSLIKAGFKNLDVDTIREDIQALLDNETPLILFARETPVSDGSNGVLSCQFETNPAEKVWETDESEQVDFRNRNEINNVQEGDLLAEITEPTEHRDGQNVLGEKIPAKQGRKVKLIAGPNTRFSEDGSQLFAETQGAVKIVKGRISVDNIKVIRGDVDYHSGNIDFKGDVIVHGDVKETFSVCAVGDVRINGTVDRACVQSDSNIEIQGGVYGKEDMAIQALGNISVGFAENANLEAGENIYVRASLVNCSARAKNKIYLKAVGKSLIGGHIIAAHGVESQCLGNPKTPVKTIVEFGLRPGMKVRMMEIERLLTLMESGEDIGRDQTELIDEVLELQDDYAAQMTAKVIARQYTYPGVRIVFGKSFYEARDIIDHMMFYCVEGRKEILMRRCKF